MRLSVESWLVVVFLGLPAVITFVWHFWLLSIKPRLVPMHTITQMADDLEERFGNQAEDVAFTNEDRAWRYSETFQQGLWRRVLRELNKRH